MIEVFSIHKNTQDEYDTLTCEFEKKIASYVKITQHILFTKDIQKQQKIGSKEAKISYTKAYENHLNGYCVALDERGKSLDSMQFAKLLEEDKISFFIGGAYGFESAFLDKCQKTISLSSLTMSHKIAKLMLFEQIYRGCSILNNHPYHK